MKKVTLVIGGKQYTISLDEALSERVERELREIFAFGRDNDIKILLQAFLAKQIECLELESRLNDLLKKLPD